MSRTLDDILTPAGRRWFAKFKLDEKETLEFIRLARYTGYYDTLYNNCGAAEIPTESNTTLPRVLAFMISGISPDAGDDGNVTLFVATWNDQQEDTTAIYKKAGFKGLTRWVRNPNSGNRIRGMMATINPAYRKQIKEDW